MLERDALDEAGSDGSQRKIGRAQWSVVALVGAFFVAALLYKWLMHEQLGHSAAMFVGLPAVLAILLALAPRARTATGGIVKGITLALLIVAPLVGEGYVCVLVAAPLFYGVGIVVGLLFDWERRRRRRATVACVAGLLLLPMCLEGVVPEMTVPRRESVVAERVVSAPAEVVERMLGKSLEVKTRLPGLLGIGFPRPLWATGEGLAVGDERRIHFSGAEGDPPGDLAMRVAERRPGFVRFEAVSDGSKLKQWVLWTGSEVEWRALDAGHTRVRWRITFDRQLDPAWYFGALERFAVGEAAGYLIEANAASARMTPR